MEADNYEGEEVWRGGDETDLYRLVYVPTYAYEIKWRAN